MNIMWASVTYMARPPCGRLACYPAGGLSGAVTPGPAGSITAIVAARAGRPD